MGELRKGVGLVHELGKLAGPEEFFYGSHHRPDVDQGLGRDHINVLNGHALPHNPLHPAQADPELVLQKFTHTLQPPVAQMIDVIHRTYVRGQAHHVVDGGQNVAGGDGGHLFPGLFIGKEAHLPAFPGGHHNGVDPRLVDQFRLAAGDLLAALHQHFAGFRMHHVVRAHPAHQALGEAQLLVDLVPAHAGQIVTFGLVEERGKQPPRAFLRGRFPGAQALVDLDQGLGFRLGVILFQSGQNLGRVIEGLPDSGIVSQAHGADEDSGRQLAGAVNAYPDHIVGVRLKLQPSTAVGDNVGRKQLLTAGIQCETEVNAGRPH